MKSVEQIDALGYKKWQAGFCHIYAEALQKFLGKGQFACIWVDSGFAHIYLSLEGKAYDSENRGVPDRVMHEIWIAKGQIKGWNLEVEKRNTLVELSVQKMGAGGLNFGSDLRADAYDGPEKPRLLTEAATSIAADPFYQGLKG